MGICQYGSDEFGGAGGTHVARPVDERVEHGFGAAAEHDALLAQAEALLHLLVQHPLKCRLRHAQVAGAHPLVQAGDALDAERLPETVPAVALLALLEPPAELCNVLIQLQTSFDQPDGVGGRRRREAGQHGGREVDGGRLLSSVEVLGDEPLAVAVRVEVDRAGRYDSDQVRAETLEERPPALGPLHGDLDLERLPQVEGHGAYGVSGMRVDHSRGLQLLLVDIGLEPRLEDVQGSREGGGSHSANAIPSLYVSLQNLPLTLS